MRTHRFRPALPSVRPLVIALGLLAPLCVPAIASAGGPGRDRLRSC